MSVHKTAIIEGNVKLGKGVSVGAYSIIQGDVEIGDNTRIGNRVSIKGKVRIGQDCNIYDGAIIGEEPQHLKYEGEEAEVVIGNGVIIREYVTIHRGTRIDKMRTVIGDNCMLMAYSHVAHDCVVGNNVVMANCATLAGHVEVGDYVFISGLVGVQQWTKIGSYVMIAGLTGVDKHIPPFTRAAGNRVSLYGLNLIGLRLAGFSKQDISAIKEAYKLLFKSPLPMATSLDEVERLYGDNPKVQLLVSFLREVMKDAKVGIATDKRKYTSKEETS
jgi:UDP-N-acetylglucosamine acyltransferase